MPQYAKSSGFQRLAIRYAVAEAKASSKSVVLFKKLGFPELAKQSLFERRAMMHRAKTIKAQPCATYSIRCNMTGREFYQFDGSEGDMRIWLSKNGFDYRTKTFDAINEIYRVDVVKIRR